jgi:hypothetical protein
MSEPTLSQIWVGVCAGLIDDAKTSHTACVPGGNAKAGSPLLIDRNWEQYPSVSCAQCRNTRRSRRTHLPGLDGAKGLFMIQSSRFAAFVVAAVGVRTENRTIPRRYRVCPRKSSVLGSSSDRWPLTMCSRKRHVQ